MFRLDARKLYYESSGILKHVGYASGEKWLVEQFLPRLLSDIDEPVLLDIGANVGEYSIALAKSLPSCRCYAFEPNPITFKELAANTGSISNIRLFNCGASSKGQRRRIFVYKSDSSTGHASLYRDVFKEFHLQDDGNIGSLACSMERIDELVESRIIAEAEIHFIKIDTEGHELESLKGMLGVIRGGGVRALQFEFNEMNVISRVFLKDFYDILGDEWSFFRLDTKKLISLGHRYDPANEIFKFQNIVAIRKCFLHHSCL
ncbi:FkbM family methyltransferase [Cyanobium sp. PCC 7001]|nr:FkbM family methyltransferase [Cyanobium sp. PCC 7001]